MFKLLETVALTKDLPSVALRKGDLGAIVEILQGGGLEVEFVAASGKTQALVTLDPKDIRAVGDTDLLSVRSLAMRAS